jgi:hypothetical chaperone protein
MDRPVLAIDFGTSNSAAAILDGGTVRRILIEGSSDTLPTAVFFPADGGPMRIGTAAAEALIDRIEGRYMRALKSVLGTSLLHEPRLIGGRRRTIAGIITDFLVAVKRIAEDTSGQQFTHVLSGRPVHFHSRDPERDVRAEADLRACYHAAGFQTVDFLFEPEAAALASHQLGTAGQIGLIVDIGGGTSDFSVFRTDEGHVQILASHGIRLGGTNFDHAVSMSHVMPLLGQGGALRREMGPGETPVPQAIYVDLATWEKIPFLYAPDVRRNVAQMAKLARDPRAMGRLVTVLTEEMGHDVAFAVERGKIAANGAAGTAQIDLGGIENGLAVPVTAVSLDRSLDGFAGRLSEAAAETLRLAGIAAGEVATVILVGGSSLMTMVARTMTDLCPGAKLEQSEAFTAVIDGLALATGHELTRD